MRSDKAVATGVEDALDVLVSRFRNANHREAAAGDSLDRTVSILNGKAAVFEIDEQPVEACERQHFSDFRTRCGEQGSDEWLGFSQGLFERSVHADNLSLCGATVL